MRFACFRTGESEDEGQSFPMFQSVSFEGRVTLHPALRSDALGRAIVAVVDDRDWRRDGLSDWEGAAEEWREAGVFGARVLQACNMLWVGRGQALESVA